MDDELEEVKATLRAVAVSTPARLNAMSLLRDYRRLVFSLVPVWKFGYRDPVKFLREMCCDCFLFQGSPRNPDLTLIVPPKIQHLDRWVRHQRMPLNLQHIGRRRSVLQRQLTQAQIDEINESLQAATHRTQDTPRSLSPSPITNIANSQVYRDKYNDKKLALEQLKREISEIIDEHPRGIWCIDLLRLYEERHSRELDFMRFGYVALVTLARDSGDVLAIYYPREGDNLLVTRAHAAAYPPPPVLPRIDPRCYELPTPPIGPDEALPGVPYDPGVFPEDCMGLNQRIPAASLADVKLGECLPVHVSEVYTPSHFWMMRIGDDYAALTAMMKEMNKYYESEEGRDRRLNPGNVRVGYYVTARYEGDWHRTLIVQLVDCTTVKVRYVDYGTVEKHDVSALRLLLRRWGALPAQALRSRLTGVRPYGLGRRWSIYTTARFLELVTDRRLDAVVYAIDLKDRVLEVDLVNTATKVKVCIGEELLSEGHAHPAIVGSAISMSECYLFPHFAPLERGATYNYAELCEVLNYGFVVDYMDLFRRFAPPDLPTLAPWEPEVLSPTPPSTPPRPASPAVSPPATPPRPASPAVCPPETPPRPASPAVCPPAPSQALLAPLPFPLQQAMEMSKSRTIERLLAWLRQLDLATAITVTTTMETLVLNAKGASDRTSLDALTPPATPPAPPPRPASPGVCPPAPSQALLASLPLQQALETSLARTIERLLEWLRQLDLATAFSVTTTAETLLLDAKRAIERASNGPLLDAFSPPATPQRPASPASASPGVSPPAPSQPFLALLPLPLQLALETLKFRTIESLLASLRQLDLATAFTVTTIVETLLLNAKGASGPSLDALTPPATPSRPAYPGVCPPATPQRPASPASASPGVSPPAPSQPFLALLPLPLQLALETLKFRTIESLLASLRQLDLATAFTVTTIVETLLLNAKGASGPSLDALTPPATPSRPAYPGVCPPAPSQALLAPLPLQQALETSLARTIERLLASLRRLDLATAIIVTTAAQTLVRTRSERAIGRLPARSLVRVDQAIDDPHAISSQP